MKKWKTLQKIKELRDWVAYLDGNQLPDVPETNITKIVNWSQKAMLNPIYKRDMANWVYDTINM